MKPIFSTHKVSILKQKNKFSCCAKFNTQKNIYFYYEFATYQCRVDQKFCNENIDETMLQKMHKFVANAYRKYSFKEMTKYNIYNNIYNLRLLYYADHILS